MNNEPQDDESTSKATRRIYALPRLGNVQLMLFKDEDAGPVKAHITHPGTEWSMEELAALGMLCKRATEYAIELQTLLPLQEDK